MDLLESVEFGDWLINEITQGKSLSLSKADTARHASQQSRINALENAKSILLEFLVLQNAMSESAAIQRRRQRAPSGAGKHMRVGTRMA